MIRRTPKHVHNQQLVYAYWPPSSPLSAMGGQVGSTVLVFRCECLNGPDSVDTKIVAGRLKLSDITGAGGSESGGRHVRPALPQMTA